MMLNHLADTPNVRETLTATLGQFGHRGMAVGLIGGSILLCLVTGCKTPVRLTVDELRTSSQRTFSSVTVPSRIQAVIPVPRDTVLDSTAVTTDTATLVTRTVRKVLRRETIVFDSAGGTLDIPGKCISGRDTSGGSVRFGFDTLLYVRFERANSRTRMMAPQAVIPSIERAQAKPRKQVSPGRSPCWDIVDFAAGGGQLNEDLTVIRGIGPRGTLLSVPLQSALHAQYNRRDWVKTVRWVSSLAALLAVGLGAYSMTTL